MDVEIRSDDVDNLVRAVRTHADAKAIRRDLARGLARVSKPVSRQMTDVIDEALPSRGGLAESIRDATRARISAKSGKYAGVSIWFQAPGHDIRLLTRGRLRHPVYGNRGTWVSQDAGVDTSVFTAEFEQQKPEILRAVNAVLEDIARKVTNI